MSEASNVTGAALQAKATPAAGCPRGIRAAFRLVSRFEVAAIGVLLVVSAPALTSASNPVAAGGTVMVPSRGGHSAATANPPLASGRAVHRGPFADSPSAGTDNASSLNTSPRATDTPSWMVALPLDGTTLEGLIGTQDDEEFFRIDVDEMTMAEIGISAEFLCKGVLLSSEGHELISSDRLIRRLLPAGQYYLRVSAYRHASSVEQATGSFTVTGAGASASPSSITLGEQSHEGSIDSDSNEDYFELEVTEPTEVNAYTIGGLDTVGRLFDSTGRWLAENHDDGDDSNFRIQRPLWPGRYFLEVSGNDGETGSYTLKAEGTELSADTIAEAGSSGDIEQRFERDYFQFEIEEGSEAVIYTEGNLDTLGELLDATGNLIGGSDSGGDGSNFRMRTILTQPGQYYLKVRAWGDSTGDYTVHAERTALSSVELSVGGSPQEGTIEAEGDRDYFHFEVTALTEAAIYTVGAVDSYGELFDAGGREISSTDDGGDGDNFRIEPLLWPGTYYVRVSSNSSAATGSYTLHLEGTQPSIATLSLDGSTVSGTIVESDESNFFRIETTAPTAAMIHTAGGLDTAGLLYDSEGQEIASNDDGGEQFVNFRIVAILLRSGEYTLRVFSSSGQTGSYTIRADGIAAQ